MAEKFEQVGVEAVVKNLDTFLRGMEAMQESVNSFTTGVAKSAPATKAQTFSLNALSVAAGFAAVEIGKSLFGAIKQAVSGMAGLGQQALFSAGRVQELTFAAQAVGQSLGKTRQEIDKSIDDLRDLNLRSDVAAQTVLQFTRNNLELAKSTDLVSTAQGLAIVAGGDTSDMVQRLVDGITRQNSLILRTAGVVIPSMLDVYQQYADQMNITGRELTAAERSQAVFNEVIRQGAPLAEVYGAAMQSPTKALRSFTQREIPNFLTQLGEPFLNAWSRVISALRNFTKALTAAVSEGGALFPFLVRLGAVASLAGDQIVKLSETITNALFGTTSALQTFADDTGMMFPQVAEESTASFVEKLVNGLSTAAETALGWGVEIVANLAEGIVMGASTILNSAMRFIGKVLSSWLAPGSPPKVAPKIDLWGADAMNEWLQGFTKADFGILESIQGPLRQILGSSAFKDISLQLTEAIAGIGKGAALPTEIFDKIANKIKVVGPAIAKLAKSQFQLAQASNAAADAQRRLDEAQTRVTGAQSAIRRLTDEYNDLLRAGASDDILQARLAEIKAAEDELSTARTQVTEAESANEEAQNALGPLKEQADLQKMLVKQLLSFTKAQDAQTSGAGAMGKAAKKALGDITGALAGLEDSMGDIDLGDAITAALDAAKGNLESKLADIFEPLTTRWKETIKPALDELFGNIVAWANENGPLIKDAFLKAWQIIVKVVRVISRMFKEVIIPEFKAAFGELTGALDELGIKWEDVFIVTVKSTFGTIVFIIALITSLINVIAGIAKVVAKSLGRAASNIRDFVEGVTKLFVGLTETVRSVFMLDLDQAAIFAVTAMEGWWQATKAILRGAAETFRLTFDIIITIIKNFVGSFIKFFLFLYDELVGNSIIPDLVEEIIRIFTETDWVSIGKAIVDGIIVGITNLTGFLIATVQALANDAVEAIEDVFGIGSPSKVMIAIGKNLMASLASGMENLSMLPAMQMQKVAMQVAAPVSALPITRQSNINFNSTVRSEMDLAILTGTVKQVLRQELGA